MLPAMTRLPPRTSLRAGQEPWGFCLLAVHNHYTRCPG